MTLFNILVGDKSPELRRLRLAALCMVFLMGACAFGERAHAAVDCGPKAPSHATQCRARTLSASHGTQTSVQASGSAASDSNGARLIPLAHAVSATQSASMSSTLGALSHVFHGPARGAQASVLPLDRSPVVRVSDARGALGDVMGRTPTPGLSADVFSPPVAWSLLLAGLFGLFMMTRGSAVARAESWATATTALPAASGRRSGTRASALDRLDVARYIQAPIDPAHQGHFVRAAAASRFG